ncbi:4-alpha-glucanotransferase [Halothiobacillus sp. 15-55-196]|jgi:4-alpha-glucanotransferase|uniref:4-alpha-glucanotransferase n=1 Tax=Halothiobacillus sp. 15-55-196 TaxID=1970382 RepID=UPI0025BA2499|nr:4-alpha-glucanotransferase [Halothiobacillus sp. 15-55-196]
MGKESTKEKKILPEMPCALRRAGVLAPVFSLPSGDFGPSVDQFLTFMNQSRLTVWQVLPLGPPLMDGSPYQCASSFAINPAFLSDALLLNPDDFDPIAPIRERRAGQGALPSLLAEFDEFCRASSNWLDDYALFIVIKSHEQGRSWLEWRPVWRDRDPASLEAFAQDHAKAVHAVKFEQFLLDRQWRRIVTRAHELGVLIYGDLPIFVAGDSADVWANRAFFQLDERGLPTEVAGVPPDYFSATGQRWGNPLFDWSRMAADGFSWWKQRMARHIDMFDWVRIDHFRGLAAYWSIPAQCDTAIDGRWVEAPGAALLTALSEAFGGDLPIIAEDLGVITEDVTALRKAFGMPGMLILQFAFDSDDDNPYLPANHHADSVVYTGTHDNDTTLGWWQSLSPDAQAHMYDVLAQQLNLSSSEPMPMALLRAAMASVAQLAIIPMADWLGCDSSGRINTPGTPTGNWTWQFERADMSAELSKRIRALVTEYQRDPG